MKYAELHYFAHADFVQDGFTMFCWCVTETTGGLPLYQDGFGIAVDVTAADPLPETFARYNPETGEWAAPLADDAVPTLRPFYEAQWNGTAWTIAPASQS